jgi:hypothetical protein
MSVARRSRAATKVCPGCLSKVAYALHAQTHASPLACLEDIRIHVTTGVGKAGGITFVQTPPALRLRMMCFTPYEVGDGLRLVVVQVGASVVGRSTEELSGGMPQPCKCPAHAHDTWLDC